jgi:hypothetical protein
MRMSTDIKKLSTKFKKLLKTINKQRPGFFDAVYKGNKIDKINSEIPNQLIPNGLIAIYLNVGGDVSHVKKNFYKLSPLVPEYIFLELSRIKANIKLMEEVSLLYPELQDWKSDMIPFLTNESGCFYCVRSLENDQSVHLFLKDDPPLYICSNLNSFFDMILEQYTEKAYFTDEDGYLDCNWELLMKIRNKYSP